jgi:hypothetical protein
MHDLRKALGFPYDDDDKPPSQKLDGRSTNGRLVSATRRTLLAEFPHADALRLREAVTLSIAIARLEPKVLAGDQASIAVLARLSNRMQCLRRELRAAKDRPLVSC